MNSVVRWMGCAALGLAVTGCVSQEKYQALKMDRDQLSEKVAQSESEARTASREAELLRNQLNSMQGANGTRDALTGNLTQQNADLQKQLDELNEKYRNAMGRSAAGNALPEPLTNTLTEFARQYPDLVDFDAHRGVVKFKSDVTFNSGDATVTSKAKEVITKFSSILNSPGAAGYELIVAGHTDSTRVVSANTIKAGHKDNWFLSAHRAISVAEQLQDDRVSPQRIGVTGYADQRPIASNASDQGRAQNRRVEVLILPNQVRSAPTMASTGARMSKAPMKSMKDTEMSKDAAIASPAQPTRPIINK